MGCFLYTTTKKANNYKEDHAKITGQYEHLKFHVHVLYCASWGFESMFKHTKNIILKEFPAADVVGEKTPGVTGAFDINVTAPNGQKKLVFSKNNGDGTINYSNAPSVVARIKSYVLKNMQ